MRLWLRHRHQFVPEGVPVLSRGRHRRPSQGACFMEYASFLAGERWSDSPACTHPLLAALARGVNDTIGDAARQQLVELVPSVVGLKGEDRRVDLALTLWVTSQALPHVSEERQHALAVGLLAARRAGVERQVDLPEALVARSEAALQEVPLAAEWATRFSARHRSVARTFGRPEAVHIFAVAVQGLGESGAPERDRWLQELLAGAIEVTRTCLGLGQTRSSEATPAPSHQQA